MTTVILLFAFPLGLLLYWFDRKNVAEADRMYEEFIDEVKADKRLEEREKIRRIDDMFYLNGFKTLHRGLDHLTVEKKHLNLGIPIILFALLSYFGILFFLLYYFYFLKAIRKEIRLDPVQE